MSSCSSGLFDSTNGGKNKIASPNIVTLEPIKATFHPQKRDSGFSFKNEDKIEFSLPASKKKAKNPISTFLQKNKSVNSSSSSSADLMRLMSHQAKPIGLDVHPNDSGSDKVAK